MMAIPRSCFLCFSSHETEQCKQCEKVFTCKQHLKTHSRSDGACYPFKVEYDCEMGRYLVATRTIKPGEVIMHESPAVLGPYTRSKAQCLNCFKLIDCKIRFDCHRCGFPVCGDECARGKYHKDECELFDSVGLRATIDEVDEFDIQYSAVTVLRLLRVMEREEEMKKVDRNNNDDDCSHILGMVSKLMDHNEERQMEHPDIWNFEKEFIINFIQKVIQTS